MDAQFAIRVKLNAPNVLVTIKTVQTLLLMMEVTLFAMWLEHISVLVALVNLGALNALVTILTEALFSLVMVRG